MSYPARQQEVKCLIEDHLTQIDEHLLLAIYYKNNDKPNAECILEVFLNYGLNEVSWDNEIFDAEYNSTQGFPMQPDERLSLLLTSPTELRHAIQNEWPQLQPVRNAIAHGQYSVIYRDDRSEEANQLLASLTGSSLVTL